MGYNRIANFASPEQIYQDNLSSYTSPQNLPDNNIAYDGKWKVSGEYANPQKGASLYFNFDAKEVFLVMRPTGKPGQIKVYVDNQIQYFGVDNQIGIVTIDSDRLYNLIKLPTPGRHILKLEFEDSNTELYAFTFG